ncbi:hypothetical protein Aple_079640 [Acrocarpospora pleiomorpha]|uniref:Carbohydrate kinase PfkB domain-containing protein n=1 Tax=Acrocarpospora pleiomorpha TaxID=90975 RepID=A0A5M3XV51_9ACTN|nr:PfkB family carbohydrate kinase [Acrocarpospora pleiomorpha]GES25065.1 hypothetical protein Aple_079640 [Acrocarpospora pleiomorpha]
MEIVAQLGAESFRALPGDHLEFGNIERMVGGTAVSLAAEARYYFRDVRIISCIGDDDFTKSIENHVHGLGVRNALLRIENLPNSVCLTMRDAEGSRILFANQPTPASRLTFGYVQRQLSDGPTPDLIFADGYLLLTPVS